MGALIAAFIFALYLCIGTALIEAKETHNEKD